ncbi:MAG: sulfate adenylyltransferase [Chloroflexi bacterium]|nr:sulfate adenylyltransferase [Chloroflexota bacterium]
MIDNSLSPHGGQIVERVLRAEDARAKIRGLRRVPVRGQMAREIISIAYGFFSPIEGFMGRADVDSVARNMTLASGYVWSIPLVFDMSNEEIDRLDLKEGDSLLIAFQDQPLATLDVEEIYSYDKEFLARQVYGTAEEKHPGVKRTYAYKDKFLGGKITLVNPPRINPPFDQFWLTPKELRARLVAKGWDRVVAHQTRNVPHTGHEWLMKGAWFAANADGILVNPVIGEKRPGDYIDEAIILTHDTLRKAGYFREEIHTTSMLLWDMRYAGPREAVFHAIVRKNLGCTHHMFGRDHAGVGTYYDTYAAHSIFNELPDLGIKPVKTLEWFYCPDCAGIVYEEQCGHVGREQKFSGSLIRSIIQDGVKPTRLIFRPEVFDVLMECAEKYGFGTPFVTEHYLQNASPVLTVPPMSS